MELLCLEFINSEFHDFRGRWVRDDLCQPGWLTRFLEKWHLDVELPVNEALIEQLLELRSLLIRVVETLQTPQSVNAQDVEMLNLLLCKTVFHSRIERVDQAWHLTTRPVTHDWYWIQSAIITDFLTLLANYDPLRIKICENPHCRWIFYDETKSRTRRYCSSDKCANLMKVRRFRAKQKEQI